MKEMKTIKCFVVITMTVFLASCGGNKSSDDFEEIILKPAETEIAGDLEGCFTIVDKEYKAKATEDFYGEEAYIITVQVERTNQELPFELNGRKLTACEPVVCVDPLVSEVQVGFGLEFFDEDENIIEKISAYGGGYYPEDAVELVKLKPGKKGSIRLKAIKGAVSFRISSVYSEDGEEDCVVEVPVSSYDSDSYYEDDDDDSYSSRSSGSEDWDEVLQAYEEYVDKYTACLKKAAKGDLSAVSEYPALMEKAQEIDKKIEKAKGELSTAQWERYNKATLKMVEAAKQKQ